MTEPQTEQLSQPGQPEIEQPQFQTELGLNLPITIEHFRSLEVKQQNALVSEQVLKWQRYEWEEECSQLTSGARWQYGGDYWATECSVWAPPELDAVLEDDEEALFNWIESFGSRD